MDLTGYGYKRPVQETKIAAQLRAASHAGRARPS